jgi:hypothetical protein
VTGLLQKEEVSKKKKEKDKTYEKNSPVAMLGVGAINKWRETYLTPIR